VNRQQAAFYPTMNAYPSSSSSSSPRWTYAKLFDDNSEDPLERPREPTTMDEIVLLMNGGGPEGEAQKATTVLQTGWMDGEFEHISKEPFLGRKPLRCPSEEDLRDFKRCMKHGRTREDWVKVYGSLEKLSDAIRLGAFSQQSGVETLLKDIDAIGAWMPMAIMQEGLGMVDRADFETLSDWCSLDGEKVNVRLMSRIAFRQRGRGMISKDDFQSELNQWRNDTAPLHARCRAEMPRESAEPGVRSKDLLRATAPKRRASVHFPIAAHFAALSHEKREALRNVLGDLAKAWEKQAEHDASTLGEQLQGIDERTFQHYRTEMEAQEPQLRPMWMKWWWQRLKSLLSIQR